MPDAKPTPIKKPLPDRMIRSGMLYLAVFGGLFLGARLFITPDDPSSMANLARIFANVLPIALVCAAVMLVAGLLLKFKSR